MLKLFCDKCDELILPEEDYIHIIAENRSRTEREEITICVSCCEESLDESSCTVKPCPHCGSNLIEVIPCREDDPITNVKRMGVMVKCADCENGAWSLTRDDAIKYWDGDYQEEAHDETE
jgi:hypothetical protein